jgi:tRNA C32,U32 (ribose-2'-O)-methylase TrmJ
MSGRKYLSKAEIRKTLEGAVANTNICFCGTHIAGHSGKHSLLPPMMNSAEKW